MIAALIAAVVLAVAVAIAVYLAARPAPSGSRSGSPGNVPSINSSISSAMSPFPDDPYDDSYKAYGEVPIPGTQTLHLPAGQVAITFHAVTATGSEGSLAIPDLNLNIDPPAGVAKPKVTESVGGTSSIDNDSRRRVWVAEIPQDGNYQIRTDGKVTAFISAKLAFGPARA